MLVGHSFKRGWMNEGDENEHHVSIVRGIRVVNFWEIRVWNVSVAATAIKSSKNLTFGLREKLSENQRP